MNLVGEKKRCIGIVVKACLQVMTTTWTTKQRQKDDDCKTQRLFDLMVQEGGLHSLTGHPVWKAMTLETCPMLIKSIVESIHSTRVTKIHVEQ